jgi:NAD(P)H dehydrogenase (quinone)
MTTLAITGSTGGLGGRVARRLAEREVHQRLVVRDPHRAPRLPRAEVAVADYGDRDAMLAALAGVDTLLLVSASETEDRVQRHLAAVEAASTAGVRRVVYVSFLGAGPEATFTLARHHWQTEEAVRSTGLPATFLRDGLYQDVLPYWVGPDLALRGPAADGRISAVARDDIADAAVAVLLDESDRHDGRTYELTGPAALSLDEIATILARHSGRSVTYHTQTIEEAYASRAHYGAPDWMVEGWVSTYAAAAAGELDVVTDDVRVLTGHSPLSLDEFLDRNPEAVEFMRRLGG